MYNDFGGVVYFVRACLDYDLVKYSQPCMCLGSNFIVDAFIMYAWVLKIGGIVGGVIYWSRFRKKNGAKIKSVRHVTK